MKRKSATASLPFFGLLAILTIGLSACANSPQAANQDTPISNLFFPDSKANGQNSVNNAMTGVPPVNSSNNNQNNQVNRPRLNTGNSGYLASQDLIRLASPEVTRLLGPPEMTMREGNYEIWRYRQPQCQMDIYIAHEGVGQDEVRYIAFRNPQAANGVTSTSPCWLVMTG